MAYRFNYLKKCECKEREIYREATREGGYNEIFVCFNVWAYFEKVSMR